MTAKALVEAIAGLVIFLTLAGLGLFKVPSDEPTVEAGLRAQAEALMAEVPNPPVMTVKGRVITVEGLVQSHADRRHIESALNGITGVEEVRASLTVMPEVESFTFSLSKDESGVSLSGHLTRAAIRETLGRVTGAETEALQLSRGAPMEGWDEALIVLAEAVQALPSAEISVTGLEGSVTGTALWPADAARVAERLGALPEAMQITLDLNVIDDGAPFLLVVERDLRRGDTIRGKLPPDLKPEALTALLSDPQADSLVSGPVDPGYAGLSEAMTKAVQVLASAEEGVVTVTPGSVVLNGLRGGAALDTTTEDLRASLSGDFRVDVSRLPQVVRDPFWVRLDRTDEGVVASGLVPRDVDPAELGRALDADVSRLMQSDYPDTQGWAETLTAVQAVFVDLAEGAVLLEEKAVSIEGYVPDRDSADRVDTGLDALSGELRVTRELIVIDEAAPFLLVAERHPRRGDSIRGKLPPDSSARVLTVLLGGVQSSEVTYGADDPAWPGLAKAMEDAMKVLATAEQGVVTVSPGMVVLTGMRGDEAMDAALDNLRAALPESYHVEFSRLPQEVPPPFWLRLERLGEAVWASGFVPRDVVPAELGRAQGADVSRLMQSDHPDAQDWSDSLTAVQEVFAQLVQGSILLAEDSVTVTGVLPDSDSAARVEQQLAALPQGGDLRLFIDVADDGVALDGRLIYAPEAGLQIAGGMPADMTGQEAAELLSLPAPEDAPKQEKDMGLPRLRPMLEAVAPWLGEAESLELQLAPETLALRAVLSPGVDLPQVEAAMRAVLAPGDRLDLSLLTVFPAEGTRRQNVALNAAQVFLAGFWLPVLDFDPSVATCTRQGELAQQADPVRFLSGEMRLDARSIRGVNALSAVARVCVLQGGLRMQVEGHSDNVGAVAANRALSQQRAKVVADEIAKRGVPAEEMTVVGFGPDRPVADNATAEGRALNRRITLSWSAAEAGDE
ncbi:OmpA family protein [Antarctobacter jejuensis]|uniref:OmpA family protein n=1 Tax=Antarctobacter jejuensis TaxID=1439938 RepID=UPI003FD0C26E